jgi:hypothetical protein
VQYNFAPNFFLSKVQDSLVAAGPTLKLDLSSLRVLTSAGEANVISTCAALQNSLIVLGPAARTSFVLVSE